TRKSSRPLTAWAWPWSSPAYATSATECKSSREKCKGDVSIPLLPLPLRTPDLTCRADQDGYHANRDAGRAYRRERLSGRCGCLSCRRECLCGLCSGHSCRCEGLSYLC